MPLRRACAWFSMRNSNCVMCSWLYAFKLALYWRQLHCVASAHSLHVRTYGWMHASAAGRNWEVSFGFVPGTHAAWKNNGGYCWSERATQCPWRSLCQWNMMFRWLEICMYTEMLLIAHYVEKLDIVWCAVCMLIDERWCRKKCFWVVERWGVLRCCHFSLMPHHRFDGVRFLLRNKRCGFSWTKRLCSSFTSHEYELTYYKLSVTHKHRIAVCWGIGLRKCRLRKGWSKKPSAKHCDVLNNVSNILVHPRM